MKAAQELLAEWHGFPGITRLAGAAGNMAACAAGSPASWSFMLLVISSAIAGLNGDKEYCARRTDLLEALKKTDLPPKQHWGEMVKSLYGEYGVYYYCPALCLNALGDDVDELYDLVEQITEQHG